MLTYDLYKVDTLPSNGPTANVVHYDFDLYFKINKFLEIYKYTISEER